MVKKLISVRDTLNGDILAEDILNSFGTTIVAKNVRINEYIKQKLIELDVEKIQVFEIDKNTMLRKDLQDYKRFALSYKEKTEMIKEVLNDLIKGEKLDMGKVKGITNSIFESITKEYQIFRYLEALKNTDEYTYQHCINVGFYAMLIARWMKLSEMMTKEMIIAGVLHDIGKTKIANEILNKPSGLLPDEMKEIRKHSVYGYEILESDPELSPGIKRGVLMHHEREDQTGYPNGVGGDKINLHAKIVAIADVYDAVTSDRVYQKKKSPFEAFLIFMAEGLQSFDLKLVNTFMSNISVSLVGARVLLNTGLEGEVVFIPTTEFFNPVIRIGDEYIELYKQKEYRIVKFL